MDRLKNLDDNFHIKIGKTSIAIKDGQDKTRGIIRSIDTWNSLQFNKKVDWNVKFKRSGFNLSSIDTSKLIFDNNRIYYLFNKRLYNSQKETIEQLKDKKGYCVDTCINIIEKMDREVELCKNNNIDILYINM